MAQLFTTSPGIYNGLGNSTQNDAIIIATIETEGASPPHFGDDSEGSVTKYKLPVVVTKCEGSFGVNHSNVQDFDGNNYLTVFGRSVNNFMLVCVEPASCKQSSDGFGTLSDLADSIKNATTNKNLPEITVQYQGNGFIIKGVLIGMDFNMDRPYRTYTLHIIGKQF